jgi:acetyl esterase/lipase
VAVAAPATDLATLVHEDIGSTLGNILTSYILWSWSRIYATPLDRIVTVRALPAVNRIAADCLETPAQGFFAAVDALPLRREFLVSEPSSVEPWRSFFARNTPGRSPAGTPLFISQGDADQIVRPSVTVKFVEHLRQRGEKVRFVVLPKVGHLFVGKASATAAFEWIESRFAGAPAPNDNVPSMP